MTNQENIVGNVYDKYGTRNPIARLLMRGFLDSVTQLYNQASPSTVLEVGCGEGALANHLLNNSRRPKYMEVCDLSLERLSDNIDPFIKSREASIYELPYEDKSFDLVVCCEVLEHLEHPANGLSELSRVAKNHVILSTPREPIWRILNLARAKYLRDFGNTPGHVQHFSKSDLIRMAKKYLVTCQILTPLPWTMLLGSPRID